MKQYRSRVIGLKSAELARGASLVGVAAGMVLFPGIADAQIANAEQTAAQTASPPRNMKVQDTRKDKDIVVTGSRITQDGYDAPTPTTVISEDDIETSSPGNIADLVNEMPALQGSDIPTTQGGQISNGATGINTLNLRRLGSARTLVLFDGKRVPAATLTGAVDINFLPDALVKRVDIVTGGASAAWGSDAVAGVVNFVLNKDFTGIKGAVKGGISTNYGDYKNYNLSLTGGRSFADGRGHVLLSMQTTYNGGVKGYPRPWYSGSKLIKNPNYAKDNGQPYYLVEPNTGFTTVAPGAIVASGPLRGLYFGPNGTPAQLNYGSIVSDPYMIGGDWKYTDFGNGPQDIYPMISRQSVFGYARYDITDDVRIYAQASYGRAHTSMNSTPEFYFGNITIQKDNAFLPAEITQRMTDLGLKTLKVGTWNADYGGVLTKTTRSQQRYLVGLSGKFNLLGSDWLFDVSGDHNVSSIYNEAFPTISARYSQAVDAVRDADGAIVCRSTLTNPGDGCVPYNILGTGVASDAAIDYVKGHNWVRANVTQDVAAATVNGSPFATWAGPAFVAMGATYRQEKVSGTTDPLSLTNAYWAGNYKPLDGGYHVAEAFAEVALPLIKDKLNVNLAARATDYSTSGFVSTWKAGFSFTPIDDIRIRFTRSRDIRAGNLYELYASGQTQTATVNDPFRNGTSTNYFQITSGSTDLNPEKADTLTAGLILNPRFLPDLTVAVDYFDISVHDAIASLSFANILSLCYEGDKLLCAQIDRDGSGVLTAIHRTPLNFERQTVRGLDFDVSYSVKIGQRDRIKLHALATHNLEYTTDNGLGAPVKSKLGDLRGGVPNWRWRVVATYKTGPSSFSIISRGVSSGNYSPNYIGCISNCPTYTSANPTINTNHIDGASYIDLSATVGIKKGVKLLFVVYNVANKAPPVAARGTGVGSGPIDTYGTYFNLTGRTVRAGIRFSF